MKALSQLDLITKIAERTNTPIRDVEAAYQAALENLREGARLLDFVPVLAAKRVIEQFSRQRQNLRTTGAADVSIVRLPIPERSSGCRSNQAPGSRSS